MALKSQAASSTAGYCKVLSYLAAVPALGLALRATPSHLSGLDVAIVGGGVAGLASAVSLSSIAGIKAKVFESSDGCGYGYGGFGLALWPNGLRALRHMDIALHDEVIRAGSVIEERLFTTCESTSIDYCREREAFGHPMLCLRLLSLHNALRRAALRHGCEIRSGLSCKRIFSETRGDGSKRSSLVLSDEAGEEEVVPADVVVGADGLKSVVRSHMGDADPPRDAECVWLFGLVGHRACPVVLRTRVHTFFMSDPGKAASLMPVGDHTYWAVALTGDKRKEALELDGDDEAMKRFLRVQFGDYGALMQLVEATPPHQIFRRPIQDRPACKSFVSGARHGEFHAALVGDAAHPTRPSLGQGANMALEDAVQLALLLCKTRSIEEALVEYDAARVLRCAKLQGDSEFVAKRSRRHGEDDWRNWGEDRQERRGRPANKGLGDANFVYNWQPERLNCFPWRRE